MGDVSFRSQFMNSVRDHVIDKHELQNLKQTAAQVQAEDPGSADAQVAQQLVGQLDTENTITMGQMEYPAYDGFDAVTVPEFTITPHYAEGDAIEGANGREQIANISQSDTLSGTDDDGNRCGTVMMNHLTRNGVPFSELAQRVGLPADQREMTYENYHRAQEKLYDSVSPDDNGIEYQTQMQTDGAGNITHATVSGEMAQEAQKLGVDLQLIHGPTARALRQRTQAVDQFFTDHPKGSLMVNVHLDSNTGDVSPANNPNAGNHYVMIFKEGNQYYLNNTGVLSNGNSSAVQPLSAAQMRSFTNTHGDVFGITTPTD